MLSKSKGQILRVATALHVLFHVGSYDSISGEITEEAIVLQSTLLVCAATKLLIWQAGVI